MPLPLRSATRTAMAGLAVGRVTGLAKRPPPSPLSTPRVFEPGLIVTRSAGPPGVSAPAATPAVASRVVRVAEPPELVTAYRPPPAR